MWLVLLLCLCACMIRSGAQVQVMQPAPNQLAWAIAFVGAEGFAERTYTDLQPNTRYNVTITGQIASGTMQLVLYDDARVPVTKLVVRAGPIVSTQGEVTSTARGQIVIAEYMDAVRKGEYQVWVRPIE
jgi:hypothetical protein